MAEKAKTKKEKRDLAMKKLREAQREVNELEGDDEAPPLSQDHKKDEKQSDTNDLDSRRTKDDFYLHTDTSTVIFQPTHPMMAKREKRQQDGKLQRYFYYKRLTDDAVLCYTEAEAANMTGKGSSYRHILRIIGVSDGSAYMNYLRTCGVKPGTTISITKAKEILAGARAADLEAARGHFDHPLAQNVVFDNSFPMEQRSGFVPPA